MRHIWWRKHPSYTNFIASAIKHKQTSFEFLWMIIAADSVACFIARHSTIPSADYRLTLSKQVLLPSVLWHCWLGIRKTIWHAKISVMRVGVVICMERVAVAKGRKMFNFQILMAFGVYHHLLTSYCRCSQYISAAVGVYHHRMASGRGSCCFRLLKSMRNWRKNVTQNKTTDR